MKELNKLENKSEVTSYPGVLKMVKVRRGKRGHRKSRSLVFRISRIIPKSPFNDSDVNCSSPEDKSTDNGHVENPYESLKVKIPKSVLNGDKENESSISGSYSHEDLTLGNEKEHSETSNINTDLLNFNGNVSCANTTQVDPEPGRTKSSEIRKRSRRLQNENHTVVECKKRPRRGRPPKSSIPENLSIIQPFVAGNFPIENEKLIFQPPKNSVWTLVPKKLFESDFFKSQVLTVRFANPVEKMPATICPSSPHIVSPSITPSMPFNNSKIQLKSPNVIENTMPTTQQKASGDYKHYKRPTVIYFKTGKKNFDYRTNQDTEVRNKPQFKNSEFSRTQNDLLYLFNKYHMLEDTVLKNYYELANGDINETEMLLSDLLSRNPSISPKQHISTASVPQNHSYGASILDIGSSDTLSFEMGDFSDSPSPIYDDVDTLSRNIIIESLRILNSEEAVLL